MKKQISMEIVIKILYGIFALMFLLGQLIYIISSKFLHLNDDFEKIYRLKIEEIKLMNLNIFVVLKEIPYILFSFMGYFIAKICNWFEFTKMLDNVNEMIFCCCLCFVILLITSLFECIFLFDENNYIYEDNGNIIPKQISYKCFFIFMICIIVIITHKYIIKNILSVVSIDKFNNFIYEVFICILFYIFIKTVITRMIAKVDSFIYKYKLSEKKQNTWNFYYFILSIICIVFLSAIIYIYFIVCKMQINRLSISEIVILIFSMISFLILGGMRDEYVNTTRHYSLINNKVYYNDINNKKHFMYNYDELLSEADIQNNEISKNAHLNCKKILNNKKNEKTN